VANSDATIGSLSALNAAYAAAAGTSPAAELQSAQPADFDGGLDICRRSDVYSLSGTLALSSNGTVTQTAAAIAAGSVLPRGGGAYTLKQCGQPGRLACRRRRVGDPQRFHGTDHRPGSPMRPASPWRA